jgi:hypothetical protein
MALKGWPCTITDTQNVLKHVSLTRVSVLERVFNTFSVSAGDFNHRQLGMRLSDRK